MKPLSLVGSLCALLFVVPGVSVSQEDEVDCASVTFDEAPQIDGALEPERIPTWLKYRMLVEHVHDEELRSRLSTQDRAQLMALYEEVEEWTELENQRLASDTTNLCARTSTMDTLSFARESADIAAQSNEQMGDRIRRRIGLLTPSGQQSIEEYIATRVTPNLSLPAETIEDLAVEDPEEARYSLDLMCYQHTHGHFPPEVEREMARASECIMRRQLESLGLDPDAPRTGWSQAIEIVPLQSDGQ